LGRIVIRLLNAHIPGRIVFLAVSETCLVALAFLLASIARLGQTDASLMLTYEQGFLKIFLLTAAFIICMYYFELYDSIILRNSREVFTRLVQVLGIVSIVLACVYYVYPALGLGRGIILIGLGIASITLAVWRRLFLAINGVALLAERTVIFGDEPSASKLLGELRSRPELGLLVVGRILATGEGSFELNGEPSSDRRIFDGKITECELPSVIDQCKVDRIIISLDNRRGRLPVRQLLAMKSRGVRIQDGLEFYEQITGKLPIESLRLSVLIFSSGFRLSRFLMIYKRVAAIVVSLMGLVISLPLLPFVAIAIKLSSPGPLFYQQKRVGRNETIFYCYKFRTMRADAEADTGPTWAGDDDPRITPVGRFLRSSRLDEIPQLWNVLKGDMSFVGPRPERPEFTAWLKQEIPFYDLRESVRPGITGWAQTRYRYGNTVDDAKEKLRYDLFYIKNMSPGLDALIFFDTIKTILLGQGTKRTVHLK
jgi:sugar transferase (PEP-CTERM system associated)